MKHKNQNLPVSPANWDALKRNVSGLEMAAMCPQTPVLKVADVRVISKEVNRKHSIRVLNGLGLRPITYQEALFALDRNPELKEQLKGRWFWIYGNGIEIGGFHTIQPDGILKEGPSPDREKVVYVAKGKRALSLSVTHDGRPDTHIERFRLDARLGHTGIAPVVVGVPDNIPINSILEEARRQT